MAANRAKPEVWDAAPRPEKDLGSSRIVCIESRFAWYSIVDEMSQLCDEAARRKELQINPVARFFDKPLSRDYIADRIAIDDPIRGYVVRSKVGGWLQGFVVRTPFTTWQQNFAWDTNRDSAGMLNRAAGRCDDSGALTTALNAQFRTGDPLDGGVVWPRVAEITLLGALGCGGWLLRYALQELAASEQYDFVVLQSTKLAIPFYEKYGFVRVGAVAAYGEGDQAAQNSNGAQAGDRVAYRHWAWDSTDDPSYMMCAPITRVAAAAADGADADDADGAAGADADDAAAAAAAAASSTDVAAAAEAAAAAALPLYTAFEGRIEVDTTVEPADDSYLRDAPSMQPPPLDVLKGGAMLATPGGSALERGANPQHSGDRSRRRRDRHSRRGATAPASASSSAAPSPMPPFGEEGGAGAGGGGAGAGVLDFSATAAAAAAAAGGDAAIAVADVIAPRRKEQVLPPGTATTVARSSGRKRSAPKQAYDPDEEPPARRPAPVAKRARGGAGRAAKDDGSKAAAAAASAASAPAAAAAPKAQPPMKRGPNGHVLMAPDGEMPLGKVLWIGRAGEWVLASVDKWWGRRWRGSGHWYRMRFADGNGEWKDLSEDVRAVPGHDKGTNWSFPEDEGDEIVSLEAAYGLEQGALAGSKAARKKGGGGTSKGGRSGRGGGTADDTSSDAAIAMAMDGTAASKRKGGSKAAAASAAAPRKKKALAPKIKKGPAARRKATTSVKERAMAAAEARAATAAAAEASASAKAKAGKAPPKARAKAAAAMAAAEAAAAEEAFDAAEDWDMEVATAMDGGGGGGSAAGGRGGRARGEGATAAAAPQGGSETPPPLAQLTGDAETAQPKKVAGGARAKAAAARALRGSVMAGTRVWVSRDGGSCEGKVGKWYGPQAWRGSSHWYEVQFTDGTSDWRNLRPETRGNTFGCRWDYLANVGQ